MENRALIIFIISLINIQLISTSAFRSHFSRIPRTGKSPEPELKGQFEQKIRECMNEAESARAALASNLTFSYHKSQSDTMDPVEDCIELLDDTLDLLSNLVTKRENRDNEDDAVRVWLSAAITNQETCMTSLDEKESKFNRQKGMMGSVARNLSGLLTNSLDMYVVAVKKPVQKDVNGNGGGGRRLLTGDFPAWVSGTERRLLEASVEELRPHAVVSGDGSGTHKSVGDALRGLVDGSLAGNGRTVIHVKSGTYHENIKITTKQKNVMLVGDGKGNTVIVGSRNNKDGWTTFQSATVAASGDGFVARDITFVNSAGPEKNQAVALRVSSDRSVVYRCSVQGYQDTLYTHSKRQFYRDNDIYGTVDFIFGNSAAVFQNCNIFARKPLPGQNNFITAQGRTSPNQNTGISIHNCKITGVAATYLGRPWQQYSRTVVMQSYIDGSVHSSGWAPWSGGFALNTLYYGEYANSGPGSSVSGRVKWSGYHPSMEMTEAEQFTVSQFIEGNVWLPSTGVSYNSGLLK